MAVHRSTTRDSVISSYTEGSPFKVKLKTPIDDHLEVGESYELTLYKVNQTIGLNVTVSRYNRYTYKELVFRCNWYIK